MRFREKRMGGQNVKRCEKRLKSRVNSVTVMRARCEGQDDGCLLILHYEQGVMKNSRDT